MKTKTPKPARSQYSALRQLCNLIPEHLLGSIVRKRPDAPKARSFTYWSQTVALMYAQFAHSIGLNDVCDSLRLHSGPLCAIRAATPPSRNNLSHANRLRPAAVAEELFWKTLDHLRTQHPGFGGRGSAGKTRAYRFKMPIHVIDSTTLELIACCMDWAKHRRRKAAAKCHLRLDLQSFLPRYALIGTAKDNDNKRAAELCAGLQRGEIVLFDKAYVDFEHLCLLDERGVQWVTRAKDNMAFHVVERRLKKPKGKVLRDDIITLRVESSRRVYGHKRLRRVVALVEIEGKEREMVFITNNLAWAASTVADLYRCRWEIEVFFKQIKQTLQLADFLGNSANAVSWQVWTALLVYVLLRFEAWASQWTGSFLRLWGAVRAALWLKIDVADMLRCYGTAGGDFRLMAQPQQAFLFPGLDS